MAYGAWLELYMVPLRLVEREGSGFPEHCMQVVAAYTPG